MPCGEVPDRRRPAGYPCRGPGRAAGLRNPCRQGNYATDESATYASLRFFWQRQLLDTEKNANGEACSRQYSGLHAPGHAVFQFPVRQKAHVRDIGNVAETETQHRHLVMHAPYRDNFHAAPGRGDQASLERRIVSSFGRRSLPVIRRNQLTVSSLPAISSVVDPN